MYELVCDIESYPEFLPWCGHTSIDEQTDSHQLATVAINERWQQTTFTTRNNFILNQRVEMDLEDGPFKRLRGTWCFTRLTDDACKVELKIEFEFSNAILAKMISPAFNKVCDTLVAAFIKRADYLANAAPSRPG